MLDLTPYEEEIFSSATTLGNRPITTPDNISMTLPPAFIDYCEKHTIAIGSLVQVLIDCGMLNPKQHI